MVDKQLLVPNQHQERQRSSSLNSGDHSSAQCTGQHSAESPPQSQSNGNVNIHYEVHPNVSTENIFDALMHDDGNRPQQSEQFRSQSVAKIRCPPIFVYNWTVTQINNLMSSPAMGVKSFTQKIIKSGIRLLIKDKADFDKTIEALKTRNARFYTHGTSDETPVKVILGGLPVFDLDELKIELQNNNILSSEVKILYSSKDGEIALYVLHFPKGSVKLRDLQKTRTLFNVVVNWRYFTKKVNDAVQCFRCQQFGHGMRYCNMEAKCVKCGELHLSKECTLPPPGEGNNPPSHSRIRCANCSQNHTANFKGCPTRKNYIQLSEEKKKRSTSHRAGVSISAPISSGFSGSPRPTYVSHNRMFADVVKENPSVGDSGAAVGAVGRVAAVVNLAGSDEERDANNNSDLFSLSEFLNLANDLFTRLASCKTKASQFLALSELMFKYVFNGQHI